MRKPVETSDDALQALPEEVQASDSAPIRDALVEAATEMFKAFQDRALYASEESDPLRADSYYLDGLGRDREVYKGPGEDEESYRDRIFDKELVVTPEAILSIVNDIVVQFSAIEPQIFESELDRWFAHYAATDSVWHSFLGSNPQYLDRLYPDDSGSNGGYVREQSQPGTIWAFRSEIGRYFVLKIPPLTAADSQFSFISSNEDHQTYISSNEDHTAYLYTNALTEKEAYDLIISRVNRAIGQSIRWQLYVDPNLE